MTRFSKASALAALSLFLINNPVNAQEAQMADKSTKTVKSIRLV